MQSPTLTRMEEDDVALDMDTLELESASEDEYDSDVSEGIRPMYCYLPYMNISLVVSCILIEGKM